MSRFWKWRAAKTPPEDAGADLLAESDQASFEASVAAAKAKAARRASRRKPADATVSHDIEWIEREDIYRPEPAEMAGVLQTFGVEMPATVHAGDALVIVAREALRAINAHLKEDLTVELGGLLIGEVFLDADRGAFVVTVRAALPAREGESTATSFSYTPEAWASVTTQLAGADAERTLVGSYHSHPGMGVFLSATDINTQEEVFPHPWQIAMVVDPVADRLGLFVGAAGRPVRGWSVVELPA